MTDCDHTFVPARVDGKRVWVCLNCGAVRVSDPNPSPHAVFSECPMCWGTMIPEHAHYRCSQCGFRDACCD